MLQKLFLQKCFQIFLFFQINSYLTFEKLRFEKSLPTIFLSATSPILLATRYGCGFRAELPENFH